MSVDWVLAVDPGKMTGYAWWHAENGLVSSGEAGFEAFLHSVDALLEGYRETALVVCERFVIGQRTLRSSPQPEAIETIGALRYLCLKHHATGPTLQSAAGVKRFVPDTVLRRVGWYQPGRGHANDALRHLVTWLVASGRLVLTIEDGDG